MFVLFLGGHGTCLPEPRGLSLNGAKQRGEPPKRARLGGDTETASCANVAALAAY